MIFEIYLIFLITLIIYLNNILIKKGILINQTGYSHQNYSAKIIVPLTGGVFIFFSIIFVVIEDVNFFLHLSIIFIIGILSDLNILKSAKIRLIFQILIILSYVIFYDLRLENTRIDFLDIFLDKYKYFNYFFVVFCILILINGSNFFDGLNTLNIGYFLIVLFLVYYLIQINILEFQNILLLNSLLIVLLCAYFLNIFNKFFLGDSGAYLLGFIFSILLIEIYKSNTQISPFFIILLLWYPCYENLFSILRKYKFKKSVLKPDSNHLHHLLFYYIKKKYLLKILKTNIITANLINLYNLLICLLASLFIYNTQIQIFLIIINIILYTSLYSKLLLFKYKLKL